MKHTLRSHVTESSRHRIVTRMASSHTKLSSKKCRIFRMGPIHLVWPPCILCVRSVTLHTFCMVPYFLYENPAPCILYVMCYRIVTRRYLPGLWFLIILYSTVFYGICMCSGYCTVQYSIYKVQYCTVYSTVRYRVRYCTVPYGIPSTNHHEM